MSLCRVREKCYKITGSLVITCLRLPLVEQPVGARVLLIEHLLETRENAKWRERSKLRSEIVEGKPCRCSELAGVSFSLAGAASASTGGPATDGQAQNFLPSHEVFLGEEEISDVSLATFYVFDKENVAKPRNGGRNSLTGAVAAVADAAAAAAAGGGLQAAGACGGCEVAWCWSRGGCHAC